MKEPIRVLCVFSTLDRGGAETMCMNLYRHLDRSRIQFDFVKHTQKEGSYEKEIEALGGKIYAAPRLKAGTIPEYCIWWKRFLKQHTEHRIVHGHFYSISAVFLFLAGREGRITVAHAHTSEIRSPLKKILISLLKFTADYRLACSLRAGRLFYGNRSFEVLRNGIDAGQFAFNKKTRSEMRDLLGYDENTLLVGIVANFTAAKNVEGVIDIFHSVLLRNPKARLLWVGEGYERNKAQSRIEEYGLREQVFLAGHRNDVADCLQAMDVFILPSFYEGLPVSLVEAQASGLHCFVSDRVSGEADITGLCTFLPLDAPDLWADEILKSKSDRCNMTESVIRAGYDVNTTAEWITEFYERIYAAAE